ncbi:hypothetical protein GCM10023186_17240 [Hymenobacter koreensis]|uniref:Bacteriophage T5 Orf172 DNA-binding domain-containing protein n=1 Tax=Hymenobacter koreensis TaxID=1084523 RepID=A0ABP8IY12_9BACT
MEADHRIQLEQQAAAAEHQQQALRTEHQQQLLRYRTIVDVEAERARIQADTAAEQAQVLAQLDTARRQAQTEQQRVLAETDAKRQQILADLRAKEAGFQAEQQRLLASMNAQQSEADALQQRLQQLRSELQALDEQADLQGFGFYQPRYSFDTSVSYQLELQLMREQQKRMIAAKTAATCEAEWTVNGSVAEGRKQTNQTLKLMLRAFNGECDAAVAKVKYNNVTVMEARIRKAYEVVNSLVVVQQATLAPTYLELKLKELYLAHEYQEKLQAEKEEQRQIREQMREEELAQREIEKAKLDAEKEEKRYADALRKAQEEVATANGAKQAKLLADIEQLQLKLAQASTNKERALSRAQLTRSGHVYVISNIGSFGEDVYKIGMTRRLEPMDRVRELGDASVPFQFDVHAIIYCDDAPALENTLHWAFHARRVNQVNYKKEFFRVSLPEIAEAVQVHHAVIEFTLAAEAAEYRKTLAVLNAAEQAGAMALANGN